MLIMFKVKNYTSFKNEVILDLRATSYVQHPSHVIKVDDKINLLKTNVLYGANASGKSNFISAMFFFEDYIFSQFISKKENRNLDDVEESKFECEKFMLSSESDDTSEFEIIFIKNKKQIQYGFECKKDMVLNEWYFIDDKKVYERKGLSIAYGRKYEKILGNYKKLPQERLYISVLDYFLDEADKEIILSDFIDFFTEDFNVFLEIHFESSIKQVAGSYSISKRIGMDEYFRKKIEGYLRAIDIGIIGIDIQEEVLINKSTGKEKKDKVVKTIHNVYNNKGEIVDKKYFNLKQESSGTLRFLSYIQSIYEMIEKGGVFIIDELSARLHPLLTKFIVDLFQDKKNKNAQLLFTTHDISLLNNKQFRRDEVIFVDKNIKGESTLYALSDLKVRDDASFCKEYLQGKYGAIPIFQYNEISEDK
jgi:AAA15 family ATPase/GTPase